MKRFKKIVLYEPFGLGGWLIENGFELIKYFLRIVRMV